MPGQENQLALLDGEVYAGQGLMAPGVAFGDLVEADHALNLN
jgi:hypothetical protein